MSRGPYLRLTCGAAVLMATAAGASAAILRPASTASTVLHGGDRELHALNFTGASNTITGADFLRFDDGALFNGVDSFAWSQAAPRDIDTGGNTFLFNPDRADNASAFGAEGDQSGTLSEVFGPYNGYKNMSYLLDGEQSATPYYVDLFFGDGFTLSADADTSTVEVALLERGGNSDMKLYGILPDGGLTSGVFVGRGSMGPKLWDLNSLEIGGKQQVTGVGVSLDSEWAGLVGLRIASEGGSYGGPDLVGIAAIPEPAAALLLLAAIPLLRRR